MFYNLDNIYAALQNSWQLLNYDKHRYDLPLTNSPLTTLFITSSYLLFVLKLGPAYMRSRPAYNIKWLLLAYNLVQVILNFYAAFWGIYVFIWLRPFNIGCITILPPDHPLKSREISLSYLFYLLKFFDLLDTVFFVLRKNFNQITFLHVYHHFMLSSFSAIYVKLVGLGGHALIFGFANTIVHGFMYTYYFVSALRPDLRGKVWWKRYITKLQITQFFLLLLHNGWTLFLEPDCQFPRWMLKLGLIQFSFMIVLFWKFYKRAYPKQHTSESVAKHARQSNLFNIGGKLD